MVSLIFTNIHYTSATNTTPEIIHQPELLMGTVDRERMPISYGGAKIYSFEQRIEFIVDFKNPLTYGKYIDSLMKSTDLPSPARAYVELLVHDIKVIDGKHYFDKQSYSTGVRYMYGEKSTNQDFLDFVVIDGKSLQVVVSLISINILTGFNLYEYITDSENHDKAWQLKLVVKENSVFMKHYVSCELLTNVFMVECSSSPHILVFLEEYTE